VEFHGRLPLRPLSGSGDRLIFHHGPGLKRNTRTEIPHTHLRAGGRRT
jgi:hypothetical protein